jgi:hypothetical protein
MATKNPRINVAFEESIAGILSTLARQENKSTASFVRELALEALEMREDFCLSKIAEKIEKKSTKMFSHGDAWK